MMTVVGQTTERKKTKRKKRNDMFVTFVCVQVYWQEDDEGMKRWEKGKAGPNRSTNQTANGATANECVGRLVGGHDC